MREAINWAISGSTNRHDQCSSCEKHWSGCYCNNVPKNKRDIEDWCFEPMTCLFWKEFNVS
jgi:hypothetical protein